MIRKGEIISSVEDLMVTRTDKPSYMNSDEYSIKYRNKKGEWKDLYLILEARPPFQSWRKCVNDKYHCESEKDFRYRIMKETNKLILEEGYAICDKSDIDIFLANIKARREKEQHEAELKAKEQWKRYLAELEKKKLPKVESSLGIGNQWWLMENEMYDAVVPINEGLLHI